MIQQADILTAVKRAWDRDKTLRRLVPGGLHHLDVTADRTPYARFQAEDGEYEFMSGRVYMQLFTVTIGVFSTAGTVDSGMIGQAIHRTMNRDRPQDFLLPGPNARVIDLMPVPGALELDENSREAKDMLVLSRAWEFRIQAER